MLLCRCAHCALMCCVLGAVHNACMLLLPRTQYRNYASAEVSRRTGIAQVADQRPPAGRGRRDVLTGRDTCALLLRTCWDTLVQRPYSTLSQTSVEMHNRGTGATAQSCRDTGQGTGREGRSQDTRKGTEGHRDASPTCNQAGPCHAHEMLMCGKPGQSGRRRKEQPCRTLAQCRVRLTRQTCGLVR